MPLFINSQLPQRYQRHENRSTIIGIITILFIIIALIITIIVVRYQQEIRGRASAPPPPATVCGNAPLDIMLLIDRSGSMNDRIGSSQTKIQAAKAAAKNFVDIISNNSNDRIGVASFASNYTLDAPLTNNWSQVKNAIDSLSANNETCIQAGIDTVNTEITTDGRQGIKKIAVLLTDGIANNVKGSNGVCHRADPATQAEPAALASAVNGYQTSGTHFYTIGLGNDVNAKFLQNIAATTSGQYYFSPTADQLNQIYQTISQIIGKGSVSGIVFNDANNNGIFDTNEASLSAWTVNLKDETNTKTVSTTVTDTSGMYSFIGICDGKYAVSEQTQPGWTQTSPRNPNFYSVSVTNGEAITDKNFGNIQHACGAPCATNSDCSQANGGCNICDTTTLKCSPAPSPTACPTLGAVSNIQIVCPNCPTPSPSQ